jgi:hypothetical protein
MTDAVPLPIEHASDWHPLPTRARTLWVLTGAAIGLALTLPALLITYTTQLVPLPGYTAPLFSLLGGVVGAWFGLRQFRSMAWRLDEDGFGYRRGRFFFREVRVPASRVQHLDLRHGPLERHWKLATLVIHTAGTKMSAVSVVGLDAGDAERLRDRLARQIDVDDAL